MSTSPSLSVGPWSFSWCRTAKLIEPRWIGMNGAFATRSPSGAKSAHEKSSRSFMFVLVTSGRKQDDHIE
jgi:hypothetical protein